MDQFERIKAEKQQKDFESLSHNPKLQQQLVNIAHVEALKMGAERDRAPQQDDFSITPAMRRDAPKHAKYIEETLPPRDRDLD